MLIFWSGGGAGGGLFASAGTPYGQSAGAGLGGAVDKSGQTAGMNILIYLKSQFVLM